MAKDFRTACVTRLVLVLLLALPAVVKAQFTFVTNGGALTITGYTGPGGAVTIPDSINGLLVTSIGEEAFVYCNSLTSITISSNVTNIGDNAFAACTGLTSITIGSKVTKIGIGAFSVSGLINVTIPDSVTSIEGYTFRHCSSLTNVTIGNGVTNIGTGAFQYSGLVSITIPDSVTSIGDYALFYSTNLTNVIIGNNVTTIPRWGFGYCFSLASVTLGHNVTSIGDSAFLDCGLKSITFPCTLAIIGAYSFHHCTSLTGMYFKGNAPYSGTGISTFADTVAYYLPGNTGFGSNLAFVRTALWELPYPLMLSGSPGFGVQTNAFGFIISWATNASVVVEASTTLANPIWVLVSTNTLTDGSSYFSDPQWTNYPSRFYRLRWP